MFGREGGLDFAHVVEQDGLVACGDGNDVVHAEVAQHTTFDLHLFEVGFPLDFVACTKFIVAHDVHLLKHPNAFGVEIAVEDNGATGFAVKAAALGLGAEAWVALIGSPR